MMSSPSELKQYALWTNKSEYCRPIIYAQASLKFCHEQPYRWRATTAKIYPTLLLLISNVFLRWFQNAAKIISPDNKNLKKREANHLSIWPNNNQSYWKPSITSCICTSLRDNTKTGLLMLYIDNCYIVPWCKATIWRQEVPKLSGESPDNRYLETIIRLMQGEYCSLASFLLSP